MCLGGFALPLVLGLSRRVRVEPVIIEIPEQTAQAMVVFGLGQALGGFLISSIL